MKTILRSILAVMVLSLVLASFTGCELWEKLFPPEAPKCEHEIVTDEAVAATCTTEGLTEGYHCSRCGEIILEQFVVKLIPHTKEVISGVKPTCTEGGISDGEKCSVCNTVLKEQEVLEALGHDEVVLEGKDATCTETGLTEGKKCSVCDVVLVEQTELPVVPHTYPEGGLTCSVCGYKKDCQHPAKETVKGSDATCTVPGLTDGEKCSVCGEILTAQQEISAKGHTGEVVPGHDATCTETGLTDGKKCSVCGETLTAQTEIPAKGHREEVVPGKAATCIEKGLTDGKKCSVCGITLEAQQELPLVDHVWVEATEDAPKHCEVCGFKMLVINGLLDAEHYLDMLPSLSISVVDGDKTYTGSVTAEGKWSVEVPEDLFDFTVVIHDEQGRFHDIEMMYAMVDTNVRPAEKLVPVMAKYDLWGNHGGAYVPDQNKLVYGEDGSYSLVKTESGAALDNAGWWAGGVTTGAYFVGAKSEYWVMEFDMTLLGAGGWNQWHAGITIDDNEFIMVMDRDWQLIAWTEWNHATGSSGSSVDIITNDKAAAAGIVDSQNWAPEGRPMKITAVRDNKTLHIFLNGVYVNKLEISDTMLPNSNRGASNKIGFMVKSGTEAKINNYWYELGAESVAAYLADKQNVSAPTFGVVDADGNAVEGGSVQYYKEVLISSTNTNGYVETVEWQLATEADFVEGMRLKAVLRGVDATGARVNGEPVSFANNACVFTLGKNDKIEFFSGFYYVVGADKGRVDFNNSDSIPSGDVFIVTKVQIPADQLNALFSAKGESVIGIEMRADGRAVENMLWINGGDIKLLSGDWSEGGKLMSNGALNEYGQALAGDGLYFGMQYVASSGLTYTWLGTTPYNLVRIRDWGTGGADNPGYRSFDANAKITGYSFGYVHCWTGNDANLRADVKFSDVYVGSKKPVEPATLLEAEKAAFANQSTSNTINGVSYKNAKGTLSYDAELDAAKYVIDNTAGAGKSIVPFFKGFSITDASVYTTVTFKVKIDASTCSDGFALTVRNYNKSSVTPQVITAGEWVEITLNLADFTQYFDATVSGYMVTMDTSNMKNLGLVFFVQDSATMTIETGFTMYFTDFIVK